MAQARFYLKRSTPDTPQKVFALYHVHGKQVKIYLPLSVRPSDWSKASQRVKSSAFHSAPINDRLSEIRREIEGAAFRLRQSGELTPENLKRELAGEIVAGVSERRSALDYLDTWIEEGKRLHRETTIKSYGTLKGHLQRFCASIDQRPTLRSIDYDFVLDFAEYLTQEAGLQNTSRWNMLKRLKTFLGWAYEKELTRDRTFKKIRKKDFHVVQPDIIRLNEKELQALSRLDLTENPTLANARDLFLLQCYLGVRYGDLVKIGTEHIDGDFLRLTTEKNRKTIAIPLLPEARHLIEREEPPRPLSNQKYNAYIKEVAQLAGIDSLVVTPEFRGTSRKDVTRPKYELISTHTAKRTFVSMMIARGVPVEVVMKVTGNTRSTIDRYISLDEIDVLQHIQNSAL